MDVCVLEARDDGIDLLAAERAWFAVKAVGTFDASAVTAGVETAHHRVLEADLT